MARTFIQLPPDSTGKSVDSFSYDLGSGDRYAQATFMVDSAGTVLSGANGLIIQGNVASDAPVTGNPLLSGGRASTAVPTAVSADGDAVAAWLTRTGARVVDGGVASAATDSGNPVKIGGIYSTTLPTFTNGQRGDMQVGTRGSLNVTLKGADSTASVTVGSIGGDGYADSNALEANSKNLAYDPDAPAWNRVRVVPSSDAAARTGLQAAALMAYNGTAWDRMYLSGAGPSSRGLQVTGNVASQGSDSGNPVKVGGVYSTTRPTLSNGQRVDLQVDSRGSLGVAIADSTGASVAAGPVSSDTAAGGVTSHLYVASAGLLADGSGTFSRARDLLASLFATTAPYTGVAAAAPPAQRYSSLTLGATLNNEVLWAIAGGSNLHVYIGNTRTGTVVFEGSLDGTNYVALSARNVVTGVWVTSITPTLNDHYQIPASGFYVVRARTSVGLSGTVAITAHVNWNDTVANQTPTSDAQIAAGTVASGLMGYNGTTWDRVRTANTGRLQVDVVTGGGGTQYVEDVAFGGNGTGILVVARRDDALSTLTPVEDDAVGLRANNRGALWVKHDGNVVADAGTGPWPVTDNGGSLTVDNGGTFAVQDSERIADNAAFTDGTSKVSMGGFIFDESAGTALTENDAAAARIDSKRAQVGVLEDATTRGQRAAISAAGRLSVDASGVPVPITDNAGSLTVDQATAANLNAEVQGDVASDVAIAANPLTVGGRASSAAPTDVSTDGDAVNLWLTRKGTVMTTTLPHAALDGAPYTLTSKTVQTTTTQTGSDVWSPTSGKKLVITSYQIQAGGTTAGTMQLWFGANADTTYTRGTDLAIFDGEFAPSATSKPGVVQTGLWIASAVDHEVHLTTSAAINPLTITLWGYEI